MSILVNATPEPDVTVPASRLGVHSEVGQLEQAVVHRQGLLRACESLKWCHGHFERSRMSDLADRAITALTAIGGSAAFLEILRRWLQRRQDKRQEQLQLDVRILEEGHALRQEAYQREREALQLLAEERERRHKAELAALEAQMQAKLEALTRVNDDLTRRLEARDAPSLPPQR